MSRERLFLSMPPEAMQEIDFIVTFNPLFAGNRSFFFLWLFQQMKTELIRQTEERTGKPFNLLKPP
jgi:hypothetical protein